MYYGIATIDELLQSGGILQVATDERHTLLCQRAGGFRVSDQGSYAESALLQVTAKTVADEASSSGDGDQAAIGDQADATLRRTSSAAASTFRGTPHKSKLIQIFP